MNDDECDACGGEASPAWSDAGDKRVFCTDCYLRAKGYDPEELGRRFAGLARATFADFLNMPHFEDAP